MNGFRISQEQLEGHRPDWSVQDLKSSSGI